jgi:polysaccharide pyruvyl transferase WcaK-like protein
MRLALLNLRYSANLGDVLLCECLEYGLRQVMPGIDILPLDLAGRRDYGQPSPRRLAALGMMQRLPQPARHGIARAMLGRSLRRTRPYWDETLACADAAVLGGGNLLADADLNFPLKVAAALRAVAAARLPVAVHAVGVSDNWSRAGEALFREALAATPLAHASVRDVRSQAVWARRLGPAGIARPLVTRDPGLLAAACYPPTPRPAGTAPRVALCVTHPVALRYHADEAVPPAAAVMAWYAALAARFHSLGWSVLLFTTGSPEDEACLDRLMPALAAGAATRVPRFTSARAMAGFIATLDLLAAHRLHACVVAYSFGVPHVGFTWDIKMLSFFESVDRARFLCGAVTNTPDAVADIAQAALQAGICPQARHAVAAETHAHIAGLVARLADARG